MQTITGILKNTGIVGSWTDDYANPVDTPRIAIGMRVRLKIKLCTDSIELETGKLVPFPAEDFSSCSSFYFALDSDYLKETDPKLLKTTGIRIETDEDGGSWFVGEVPNTAVHSLVDALDKTDPDEAFLTLHAEIGGFESSDNSAAAFVSQFDLEVSKRVWMGGTVPGEILSDPEYWNASQIEAYLSRTPQIQFSENGENWHDSQNVGQDEFLRVRLGDSGVWTSAIQIPRGGDGKDVYELAVENGFKGSFEDFLLSLKGDPGKDGEDGKDGLPGKKGDPGKDGADLTYDASGQIAERSIYDDRNEGFIFAATETSAEEKLSRLYLYKKRSDTSGDWYNPLVITYYSTPGKDGENAELIEALEFTPPDESGYEYLYFSLKDYPAATVSCVCVDTAEGELRLPYNSVNGITKIIRKDDVIRIYFGEYVPAYATGRVYFSQGLAGLTQFQWYQKSGGTMSFEQWVAAAQAVREEAPMDGNFYCRRNGQWVAVAVQALGSVTISGTQEYNENLTVGKPFSLTFDAIASNGSAVEIELTSGTLPAGLALNGKTISGTPSAEGTASLVFTASADGATMRISVELTIAKQLIMYLGHVASTSEIYKVADITEAMLNAETVTGAPAGTLDKTSLGYASPGDMDFVLLPKEANLKALKFDGISGWLEFEENKGGVSGSGANGTEITLNGEQYLVYGEIRLIAGETFIKVEAV